MDFLEALENYARTLSYINVSDLWICVFWQVHWLPVKLNLAT